MFDVQKFKVGDKVIKVDDGYTAGGLKAGNEYIVSDVTSDYVFVNGQTNNKFGGGHLHKRFKLAPSVRKSAGHWIVIVKNSSGDYLPAPVPRVYSSESQAKAVAASMAEKNMGEEFVIFEATGSAKAEKPIVNVEMF